MILVLLSIIGLFILYHIIIDLTIFDSAITINSYSYEIETTLYVLIFIFIFITISVIGVSTTISNILKLPYHIRSFFSKNKNDKNIKSMFEICSLILIDNIQAAKNIFFQFIKNNSVYQKDSTINFIQFYFEKNTHSQIDKMKHNSFGRDLSFYAKKILAERLLKENNLSEAYLYASQAFRENDTNFDLTFLYMKICTKLGYYNDFTYLFAKLQRINYEKLIDNKMLFSDYCILLAEKLLAQDSKKQAVELIENIISITQYNDKFVAILLACEYPTEKMDKFIFQSIVDFPSIENINLLFQRLDSTEESIIDQLLNHRQDIAFIQFLCFIVMSHNIDYKSTKLQKQFVHYKHNFNIQHENTNR